MDSILAASNPFIYEGEPPTQRGELFRKKYEKRKKARDKISQATATLSSIDNIYGASNLHLYQPTSTFNAWQTNQPHPTAALDGWQQQQLQLADIQAQTAQYWHMQSGNSKNEAITLNVTNNFKGVTQDRRSLDEISDYLARQIRDDLNAGRPLYSTSR
ncbi:hypothetical protein ACS3UN_10790 [Oscillospiraceae bacterium LTW-04]